MGCASYPRNGNERERNGDVEGKGREGKGREGIVSSQVDTNTYVRTFCFAVANVQRQQQQHT